METSAPETPDVKISDDGLYKNNHTVEIVANDNKDGDYSGIWKVDWYLLKGDYTTAADVDNAVLSSAVNSSVNENTNAVPESYAGLSAVKSLTVDSFTLDKDSSEEYLEGQYTLYVVATDFCGNTSQIAKLVYFDNSAPTASVTMTGGAYYTDDQQYYYKADNCGIEVVIYDYPYVNDQFNEVSYTIQLSNEAADTDEGVDVGYVVKTGKVTISGNDEGAIVGVSVSLTPAEVTGIKDGKISITVSLEDSAGDSENGDSGNVTTSFNSDDTNPSGGVNLEDGPTPVFILDMTAPKLASVTDSTDGNYISEDSAIYYNSSFSTYFEISDDNLDFDNKLYESSGDENDKRTILTAESQTEETQLAIIEGEAADYADNVYEVKLTTGDKSIASESYTYSLYIADRAGNVLMLDTDTSDSTVDDTGFAYEIENGTATLLDSRVIDTVAPVVTIFYSTTNNENDCYDGDTAYYNKDIKATYMFSDSNLDMDNVFTGYTKDEVQACQYLTIGENSVNEARDVTVKVEYTIEADTVNNATTDHDNDGSYNFQAYGKDKAGNALVVIEAKNGVNELEDPDELEELEFYNSTVNCDSEEKAFKGKTKIMDTIQPQVIIDYTDLEATHYYTESDEKVYGYYKNSFEVVYTFTDANVLNAGYLSIGYIYDNSYVSNIESEMTGDGTTKVVGSYTVSSGDGLWKFTVTGKDYAGNPLYIIENNVDGNGGTNELDSRELTTDEYYGAGKVLDTEAPTLTIDYTALDNSHYYTESDGVYAYYNSELTTTYTFYDRSGLDQSKIYVGYQFTPDRTVSSASSVDSMAELSEDIVSTRLYDTQSASTSWTVAAESDNNGIYNYKAYGEDKAGNALEVTEYDYKSTSGMNKEDGGHNSDATYVGQTKVMDTVSPVYTSTFDDVDADNAGAVDVDNNYTAY